MAPAYRSSMTSSSTTQSRFPRIALTEGRLDELHEAAHNTLSRTLSGFLQLDGHVVGTNRWRYLQSKDGTSAYFEKHASQQPRFSSLLVAGTMKGRLMDVMEGLYMDNNDDTRMVHRLISPRFVDAEVLHAIQQQQQTVDQPVAFMGLKWAMLKSSSHAISANRDLCFLEKLGTIDIADGRQLGYFLMQSVDLPECPPSSTSQAVRAHVSMCYLFEEIQQGRVGMYMLGTMDSQSPPLLWKVARRGFADLALSVGKAVEIAYAKRYARLMGSTPRASTAKRSLHDRKACGRCYQVPSFFGHHHQPCAGCNTVVCRKCRVKTDLFNLPRAVFCLDCVAHVHNAPVSQQFYGYLQSGSRGTTRADLVVQRLCSTITDDDLATQSQHSLRMFSLKLQRQVEDTGFGETDAQLRLTGLESLGSAHGIRVERSNDDSENEDDDDACSCDVNDGSKRYLPDGTREQHVENDDSDVDDVLSIHIVRRSLQPPEMLEAQECDQDGNWTQRSYAHSYSETTELQRQRLLLSRLVRASETAEQTFQLTSEQAKFAQCVLERSCNNPS